MEDELLLRTVASGSLRRVKELYEETEENRNSGTDEPTEKEMAVKLQYTCPLAMRIKKVLDCHERQVKIDEKQFTSNVSLLVMAASSGCTDVVLYLIEKGEDPFLSDVNDNNIIHWIVIFSETHAQTYVSMYKRLVGLVECEARDQLVRHKNAAGLTPLDLAANKHLPEMMVAILNTDSVYKFSTVDRYTYRHVMYDVSEYECYSNKKLHILHHINNISEEELARFRESNIFQSEPIKSWIMIKHKIFCKLVYMCFFYWFLYTCLFYVHLVILIERQSTPPLWFSIMQITFSISNLIEQILSVCCQRQLIHCLIRQILDRGWPVCYTAMWRYLQFVFIFLMLAQASFDVLGGSCIVGERLYTCCLTLTALTCFSTYQLFGFFSRTISHYVLVLSKLFTDTMPVSVMIGVLSFELSLAMYVIHRPVVCTNFANSTHQQPLLFATFSNTLYEMWLLSYAFIASPDIYFSDSQAPLMAIAVYITCLTGLGIVMLNVLIAVYNNRMAQITKFRDIISTIQSLTLLLFIEDCMYAQLRPFYGSCNRFWLWIVKKIGIYDYYVCSEDMSVLMINVKEPIGLHTPRDQEEFSDNKLI